MTPGYDHDGFVLCAKLLHADTLRALTDVGEPVHRLWLAANDASARRHAMVNSNAERLSLDLMVGEPHPDVPLERHPDQLPTEAELAGVRRPSWYRRALDVAPS